MRESGTIDEAKEPAPRAKPRSRVSVRSKEIKHKQYIISVCLFVYVSSVCLSHCLSVCLSTHTHTQKTDRHTHTHSKTWTPRPCWPSTEQQLAAHCPPSFRCSPFCLISSHLVRRHCRRGPRGCAVLLSDSQAVKCWPESAKLLLTLGGTLLSR